MASKIPSSPALEWLAAALGLALLLAVAVVIGREAMTVADKELPAIEVRVVQVAQSGAGYAVEFEATNRGGGTAAAVVIEGKAGDETSTATLDYVAGHASAKGGLFFTRDPRHAPLQVRALGFQTP